MSDHSGRQGKIMSITPSVAHKNTNKSTPMRRSHRRATEGEGLEAETGTGASLDDWDGCFRRGFEFSDTRWSRWQKVAWDRKSLHASLCSRGRE